MNEKDKNITGVPEEKLETVTGGMLPRIPLNYSLITENNGRYSSGDTPKYSVGQRVKIECIYMNQKQKITCEILAVTPTACMGWFYKEFGYTVKIIDAAVEYFFNTTHKDVYESCLYEN